MSEKENRCIECSTPMEYNPYQHFWYCPNPNCPPGRERFPINILEESLEKMTEKERKKYFKDFKKRIKKIKKSKSKN